MSDPATNSGELRAGRRGRRWARCVWWLVPLIVGASLRLYGLHDQVLAEDETHTLLAVGARTVGDILSTLGESSFSPPLTALARSLAVAGVPVSELTLRAPTVLAGLALLVVAPFAVARRWGRGTAALFASLLAISPLLVIHSRHARPYLPALLLTLASLHYFHAGWFERHRARMAIAAILGAAAVWVLPVAAPAVGAPWLVAFLGAAIDRPAGARARWLELAASAALAGTLVAVAFAPAAASFERGIWSKVGRSPWPDGEGLILTMAGTRASALAATLALAALAGWVIVARRRPAIALIAAAVAIGQVVAMCVARPLGFAALPVSARYLLIVLPLSLLGVAVFFAAVLRRIGAGRRSWLEVAAVAALAIALSAAGPSLRMMGPQRRLLSYSEIQNFVQDARATTRRELPAAYRFADSFEPRRVAIAPAQAQSWYDRNFIDAASRLDRDLLLALDVPKWARSRWTRLETICAARPEALLASDVEAVILHRRPSAESLAWGRLPPHLLPWLRRLDRQATGLERAFRRAWGRPHHVDDGHAVWNLRRVRRSLAESRRRE